MIGTEVTIDSLESIHDRIAALAERHGGFVLERPDDPAAMNGRLVGALRKYGLIDFAVPYEATIESTRAENVQRLRDFGFAPRLTEEEREDLSDGDEEDCVLGYLAEGISEDATWLKLFLRSVAQEFVASRPEQARGAAYRDEVVPVPMRFRVVDACLTNAPSIWFHRHFYM